MVQILKINLCTREDCVSDVLCRTARRDTHVTTSATRVLRRRKSVDWGGHVHLTFSTSCSEIAAKIQMTKD